MQRPTTASAHVAMLPELIQLVCHGVSHTADASQLSRVSKNFNRCITPMLWKRPSGLQNLLLLFPGVTNRRDGITHRLDFDPEVHSVDSDQAFQILLARALEISTYVLEIDVGVKGAQDLLITERLVSAIPAWLSRNVLLPNLRKLRLWVPGTPSALPSILPLITPSTVGFLQIKMPTSYDPLVPLPENGLLARNIAAFTAVLASVTLIPTAQLAEVVLEFPKLYTAVESISASITPLLTAKHSIRSLTIRGTTAPSTQEAIAALPNLQNLQMVGLGASRTPPGFPPHPFPQLRAFHGRSWEWQHIRAVAPLHQLISLDISLYSPRSAVHRSFERLTDHIGNNCPALNSLVVTMRDIGGPAWRNPRTVPVRLQGLLGLSMLQSVAFIDKSHVLIGPSDGDIATIAAAWPHVRSLTFDFPSSERGPATLASLTTLLSNRRHFNLIHLPIDTTAAVSSNLADLGTVDTLDVAAWRLHPPSLTPLRNFLHIITDLPSHSRSVQLNPLRRDATAWKVILRHPGPKPHGPPAPSRQLRPSSHACDDATLGSSLVAHQTILHAPSLRRTSTK